MKFLVDAHLPRRLALFLQQAGFDATHTLDLVRRNRKPDSLINQVSLAEQRIVITKDYAHAGTCFGTTLFIFL